MGRERQEKDGWGRRQVRGGERKLIWKPSAAVCARRWGSAAEGKQKEMINAIAGV